MDDWNSEVDYVVFDDFNIEFLPQYKSWFGAQKRFTITDKYRRKQTITWGKPMIWIGNDDPRYGKNVDRNWMEKNSVFINVIDDLY